MSRIVSVLLIASSLAGCQSLRSGSDIGHRIIDRNWLPPSKLFGYGGAAVGATAGVPFSVLLLPTYPFRKLEYLSGPDHDAPMPILFAPVEIGMGLGALVLGAPFRLVERGLGGEPLPQGPPRAAEEGAATFREPAPAPGGR